MYKKYTESENEGEIKYNKTKRFYQFLQLSCFMQVVIQDVNTIAKEQQLIKRWLNEPTCQPFRVAKNRHNY